MPQPQEPPAPLVVHYSPWKVGAIALIVCWLCAWWTKDHITTLLAAQPRTFHMWFSAGLGVVVTVGILVGVAAMFMGKSDVLVIDEKGVTASDLYEDRVPWTAIGGITKVAGRGVVFEVQDGVNFGRKLTRNIRASSAARVPDMACIKSGLLDQSSSAILAQMQAHQAYASAGRKRRA